MSNLFVTYKPSARLGELGRKQSRSRRDHGPLPRPLSETKAKANERPARLAGPRWVWRLVLLVLVPSLLLGGVELGLRIAGYGYPTGFFRKVTIQGKECLVDNDQFGLSFFPPALARIPTPVILKAQRPPGTFRIFIFGESAAEGDPRPQFGAGRYLEVLLRERFPETKFEVVNTAMTAINSHVILPIAKDCSGQGGDLWILYMGNNEMIGPFGAATAFGRQAPPLGFIRVGLALQRLRLGQLVMAGARKLTRSTASPASWAGMEMFLQNKLPPGDSRKEVVYKNFEANLEDILRAGSASGAKVILSTMAVNLKDCPPFASIESTNLAAPDRARFETNLTQATAAVAKGAWSEAENYYRQTLQQTPRSADLQFRLGQCLLSETNSTAAKECFQAAVDDDALIFRADSRINDLIRSASRKLAGQGVLLCEAAKQLEEHSPQGILGSELFYEHVHFNFAGNYWLARAWADQVPALLPPAVRAKAGSAWASQETCERLLGLTDWNRISIIDEVARRLQLPPFSTQPGNPQRLAAFQAEHERLQKRMDATPVSDAKAVYLEALKHAPDDYRLHENFADFLEITHDLAGAVEERKTVCGLIPHYYFPYYSLGRALKEQGQLAEAETALLKAAALNPYQGKVLLELGVVLARLNRWPEAWTQLERAHQLSPADPQILLFAAEVLWKLGRHADAVDRLREALRVNPDYWEAHYRLAEDLAMEGRIPEAVAEFKHTLRLQPGYARAHANLAVALLKLGLIDEAGQEFEETLRLDPRNPQALDFMTRYRAKRPR